MQQKSPIAALVFTGHMIDLPDRKAPRFPPGAEPAAAAAIAKAIQHHATKTTIGYASAARGGDIIFHDAARARGLQTVVVLPFAPEKFVEASVAGVASGKWVERFWQLWEATPIKQRLVLGLPVNDAAFADCNTKILSLANQLGTYRLIALWDGKRDGGVGGTAHMIETAKAQRADVDVIAIDSAHTTTS